MYNRDKAVDCLVNDDCDSFNNGNNDVIIAALEFGFPGYRSMTDEQIMQELTERGISYNFGENDD